MRVLPGQLSLELVSGIAPDRPPEPAEQAEPPRHTRRADPPAGLSSEASTQKLLTVAEVAQLTGLSLNAVYRAIWSGELQASKLRGRIRVPARAIETWVEAGRIASEPAAPNRSTRVRRPRRDTPGRGLRELLNAAAAPPP
jgi:excisionase family DNA binding protein